MRNHGLAEETKANSGADDRRIDAATAAVSDVCTRQFALAPLILSLSAKRTRHYEQVICEVGCRESLRSGATQRCDDVLQPCPNPSAKHQTHNRKLIQSLMYINHQLVKQRTQ